MQLNNIEVRIGTEQWQLPHTIDDVEERYQASIVEAYRDLIQHPRTISVTGHWHGYEVQISRRDWQE